MKIYGVSGHDKMFKTKEEAEQFRTLYGHDYEEITTAHFYENVKGFEKNNPKTLLTRLMAEKRVLTQVVKFPFVVQRKTLNSSKNSEGASLPFLRDMLVQANDHLKTKYKNVEDVPNDEMVHLAIDKFFVDISVEQLQALEKLFEDTCQKLNVVNKRIEKVKPYVANAEKIESECSIAPEFRNERPLVYKFDMLSKGKDGSAVKSQGEEDLPQDYGDGDYLDIE